MTKVLRYHRMKKKICLLSSIMLLLICSDVLSQNVTINGKISTANSQKPTCLIRLMTYNDMLTHELTTIYETKSDKNGIFKIETNIEDITLAQIAVDLEKVDIILKPNSSYDIEIVIPQQENDVSYFERQVPTLKIIKANDDNLYYQYYMSEALIDDFILNNFNQLYRARKLSLLDSLDMKLKKELGEIKSDFVKENIRYRKAAIQMVVNNDNAKKVISQYFDNQKILYSNPAYMYLFNEIFTEHLSSMQFNPSELRQQLYSTHDSFLKYIKEKDVFLADNKDLAEIIIAWNLKRLYYAMPDEKKQILSYIDAIAQNTENKNNKTLINDMSKQIRRLSFDTDAPAFSLKNKDGNTESLSDFKDNMILLQFVSHTSPMTAQQFEMLNKLSQQWQDTIQVITIATKESFSDINKMFEDKDYKWKLLNLNDDILLLEEYQIKTFPDYVIIGKKGKIGMAPAPAPDQHLDFHVRRIYKYY